jgi:hypothetical protein
MYDIRCTKYDFIFSAKVENYNKFAFLLQYYLKPHVSILISNCVMKHLKLVFSGLLLIIFVLLEAGSFKLEAGTSSFQLVTSNIQQQDTLKNSRKARRLRREKRNEKADSASDEYFNDSFLRYEDFIYKDYIRTVTIHRVGFDLSPAIFDINSGDKLILSFDDLEGGGKNYKYYIIHCDADWRPSVINDNEYVKGFMEDFITGYKYSYNTRQQFTHYDLTFPNDNLQIIASGNYLLVVYVDDDKENIALTRRFWVAEPRVTINTNIKGATKLEDRNYKQEIDFTITRNKYEIQDPYTNLKVIIMQNGRYDNVLFDVKPQIVKDDVLDYNLNGEITFNGGNEFRRFDTRTLRSNTENVIGIKVDSISKKWFVTLLRDERRPFKTYLTDPDLDGRFYIKNQDNANDFDTEPDYVWVHFTLPYNAPLVDGNLYIIGALTDWRYTKENKMTYNYKQKAYVANLYLKQGYYNYQYVFLPNGEKTGDETMIEGNHFETENEYTIFVYNREAGVSFDKLIGLKQTNSAVQ